MAREQAVLWPSAEGTLEIHPLKQIATSWEHTEDGVSPKSKFVRDHCVDPSTHVPHAGVYCNAAEQG